MIFTKRTFFLVVMARRSLLTVFFEGRARLARPRVRNMRRHFLIVWGDRSSFRQIDDIVQCLCKSSSATARCHFLLLLDECHALSVL
jgi:hypothetical protein